MTCRKLGSGDLLMTEFVLPSINGASRPEKACDTRADALLAELG